VGRVVLSDAAVLGCQAHAFVMKLAARTLAFAAKGERDAVCILNPVAAGYIFPAAFSIASRQVVVFGVRFDRTKPIGRIAADRKLKHRCSLTGDEKCH
jgi:hypothetical protein